MSRYTLKTYSGAKLKETYGHRSSYKLRAILLNPALGRALDSDPFSDNDHINRVEIYECSKMSKIFTGNIDDAIRYVNTL